MSIADEGASAISARRLALEPVLDALVGAAALVAAEWAGVAFAARAEFAGTWEFTDALTAIVPLSWLVASVGALLGAALLVLARTSDPRARTLVGLAAAAVGVAVGAGVTHGRHFAAWPLRVSFVGALAVVGFLAAYAATPRLARSSQRAPGRTALAAAALALGCSIVNHALLPRLYPAFHLGLSLMTAMTAPLIGRGLRGRRASTGPTWVAPILAAGAFLAGIVTAPRMAQSLSRADNLRMIFHEHAPLLGLGVEFGTRLAPPPPLEPLAALDKERPVGRLQIDWRGKDILLITVDALRADHVGAYGYARPTTPEIDKLAEQGTVFSRAYCPTPHTSYSVASLMTGKNLHPLLGQGLGADSDTLAGLTRIYGYRTAAFYPPAVFFIDEELFLPFRDQKLDFEYARIEFADPNERAAGLTAYLATQPREQRLLLWVHLFEPHEPYVPHAAHVFGDRDVDRYDGEVAFADAGIGRIVRAMREGRPDTVVIVTADHGEEFGEHRGRYHGTTVYEEQVRVPLVIAGPGVSPGRRVEAPVQTVDILPTVLGALDIPQPPRVMGHDLGAFLRAGSTSEGPPAVSETDDYILLADAMWRLVCARRAGACALYDLRTDAAEMHDVSAGNAERFQAMKTALRSIESTQGHYEASARDSGERPWPGPIRRGLVGEGDAAAEIAELLDDSDVRFRRKAAQLLFDLKRKETAATLRLAVARDDDAFVRQWAALALARLGEPSERVIELLGAPDLETRRAAALAIGENGDVRAGPALVEWWQSPGIPFLRAREILAALAQVRAKEAVAPLIASLGDLRLRPHIARTLAAIGQPAARAALAARFVTERHKDTRNALAAALVELGAQSEIASPLIRFLGTPDPLPDGLDLARRSGLLRAIGPAGDDLARLRSLSAAPVPMKFRIPAPHGDPADARGSRAAPEARTSAPVARSASGYRLIARGASTDGRPGRLAFTPCLAAGPPAATLDFADDVARELYVALPPALAPTGRDLCLTVERTANLGIEALAVVPLADELPPPPPEPWEGGH